MPNKKFANICDYFDDFNLRAHLVRTKLHAFFSARENLPLFAITFYNNKIKQYRMAENLGCSFNANLIVKSMALKFLRKINVFSTL